MLHGDSWCDGRYIPWFWTRPSPSAAISDEARHATQRCGWFAAVLHRGGRISDPSRIDRILALCVITMLAGCGSATKPVDDRQAVARAAHEYGKAFADGDYGHACDLMTSDGKVNLERAAVLLGGIGGCENALKAVGRQLDPAAKAKLRDAPIVGIRVNGTTASARYAGGQPVVLRKQAGRWLVEIKRS
jgi:hypothetical protein